MTERKPRIAIVGAGMGGLTAAATLRLAGFDVGVYEQASRFTRIGAGIQMMPNSMKVLRRIGIEERVRGTSFEPYSHLNRAWDTGEVLRELPMPDSLFCAPYLCMHRGDIHEALVWVVPPAVIHLRKKLVGPLRARGTGDAGLRGRHLGAGRCGRRRRRRAFAGARHHHRPRHACPQGTDRLPRGVSVGAGRQGRRPIAYQVVGTRSTHRHLLQRVDCSTDAACD